MLSFLLQVVSYICLQQEFRVFRVNIFLRMVIIESGTGTHVRQQADVFLTFVVRVTLSNFAGVSSQCSFSPGLWPWDVPEDSTLPSVQVVNDVIVVIVSVVVEVSVLQKHRSIK